MFRICSHLRITSVVIGLAVSIGLTRCSLGQLLPVSPQVIQPLLQTQLSMGELRYIGFAFDGKSLRAGGINGEFVQLSIDELKPMAKPYALPPFAIASAARTFDHRRIAIGDWVGEVIVFDSDNDDISAQLPPVWKPGAKPADALAFTKDGNSIAVGSRDFIVRMYSLTPAKLLWESQSLGQEIVSVEISDNGEFVAVTTGERKATTVAGIAVVLNAADGTERYRWNDAKSKANAVAFSKDSSIAIVGSNEAIRSYDLKTGKLRAAGTAATGNRFVMFDDSHCLVAQYPGRLILWDILKSRPVRYFSGHVQHGAIAPMISSMDVSPDRKLLATVDVTGQAYLWPLP